MRQGNKKKKDFNSDPKKNRKKNNSRVEKGGGGPGGRGQLDNDRRSKQECFHFFFSFFPLSKFEKLKILLLFKQLQAVGIFRHCLQEERK